MVKDEAFDGRGSFDDAMSAYQQARDAQALSVYGGARHRCGGLTRTADLTAEDRPR